MQAQIRKKKCKMVKLRNHALKYDFCLFDSKLYLKYDFFIFEDMLASVCYQLV